MRTAILIAVALAATLAGSVARAKAPRAEPPAACRVLPAPDDAALKPYRTGPYGAALKARDNGNPARAAQALANAWTRIRADLARSFSTDACDRPGIRRILARTVFTAPPLAIPAEDRFVPPGPILWAGATAWCQAGDLGAAANWLADAALSGDREAASLAAVLWTAAGKPEAGRALVPAGDDPLARAARAYADRRPADLPSGDLPPLARAIADLLRQEIP